MGCEYCGGTLYHDSRCPNAYEPEPLDYCSCCGEGIYEGDDYIENDDGDKRLYDCFYGLRDLLEFLGYDVKTMR